MALFQINSFLSEVKRLYIIFKPHFGLRENKHRTIALLTIISSSFISALSMVYIQEGFSALNLIIMDPNVTFSAISWGVLGCLGPICASGGFFILGWSAASWLSESLDIALKKISTNDLFDSDLYYGRKLIPHQKSKDQSINLSNVINNSISQICSNAMYLLNDFTNAFFHFVVGMNQLWYLSSPLVVNFLSLSFVIPGHMVLIALGYSVFHALLVGAMDKNLRAIEKDIELNNDDYTARLHHVEEHAEAIALKKGATKEKNELLNILGRIANLQSSRRLISASIQFFSVIGGNISYLFGIILTVPGIIAKTLDPSDTFSVAYYFSSIVAFFTWKKDKTTQINSLNISLDRYEALQNIASAWNDARKNNQLHLFQKGDKLTFNHLSVTDPNSNCIFDDISFSLPSGKATVIQGKSGIGKTTLLRCLAGLWPYVKGEVIIPLGKDKQGLKAYYIPQRAHFPLKSTLLEAILYPNEQTVTKKMRENIIQLMKALQLRREIIADLDTTAEWGSTLSGGEQQRIAMIGAILREPDVLIIDEGINAMDPESRALTEKAIKKHLKTTTVVAIDHNADVDKKRVPFYDYKLAINKSKKTGKISTALSEYKAKEAVRIKTRRVL